MIERGTTLIVLAINEGVVMVADDLVYALKDGGAVGGDHRRAGAWSLSLRSIRPILTSALLTLV
jgi:hypothetical protein